MDEQATDLATQTQAEALMMETFSKIEYKRPDMGAMKKKLKTLLNKLKKAKSYEEARAAYLASEKESGHLETSYVVASIRNTLDTTDKFYDGEMQFFNRALAQLMPLSKSFTETLLRSPFRAQFEQEFGKQLFTLAEIDQKTQSTKIIPDLIRQGNLENVYKKTTAACKTTFRGEEVNFYGLLKHMESSDREERKEAYLAWAKLYEGISEKLDQQYDKLIKVRIRMAKKLGLPDYTALGYLNMHRADYGPAEVARFREQVRTIIVPAVAKLKQEQATRLGVDKLKYYDESCIFPDGNADPVGGESVLIPITQRMYREISPETGEFFDFLSRHGLFDLETRPGKHLGGYCTYLSDYKAPFIFSNFNGTAADVNVLTHEAGHAFAGYTAMRSQPIAVYLSSTSEVNEIHSMTMEHFAYPFLKDFFGEEHVDKAKYAHLSSALAVIPYLVSVDEFQHRVYEKPSMSAKERRAVWHEIEQIYLPWRDYDGVSFLEEGGFWMQKQHIFLYPFYYVDYALAQVCAFQFYGRMKQDHKDAWESYLALCRAGGSKGYFDLLRLAHLDIPFEDGSVEKAVRHVIDELNL
ncbi:MAG TPA: M3 family oligoendopeptidase [Clostridia bacterium]|nr:M3 family oligoendopeptidase [Clostridia bacterium]